MDLQASAAVGCYVSRMPHTRVIVVLMAIVFTACTSPGGECSCPAQSSAVTPQFLCPPEEAPNLRLSGPCQQNERPNMGNAASVLGFTGTSAGTCHATLTFASGQTYSTDITFAERWFACGSDAHGCGQFLVADPSTWMIESACASAAPDGGTDSGDASAE